MKKQKQQGIKKRLTKGFVKAAVIGAIAAMIGVVALLIAASQYEKALNRYGSVSYTHLTLPTIRLV